ncbi:respiratory nitrate reductase 1 subunit alpha [Salmonella enterica subsp. arizonae]|uniref:Respiratory nitrate reductase 1 subunit alpha n=1 Tax=Salmonella enterica subsp. arizonae TaxID=59203 RepID=A0A3S5DG42_SALER|nr:respiratory nitrate reductase 1 subunit alpha [Salmonella enterica subsp. arizonae]
MKPEEVEWVDNGLDGKLDLVVTLDFRLSVLACIPISYCRPPPGMKKTI